MKKNLVVIIMFLFCCTGLAHAQTIVLSDLKVNKDFVQSKDEKIEETGFSLHLNVNQIIPGMNIIVRVGTHEGKVDVKGNVSVIDQDKNNYYVMPGKLLIKDNKIHVKIDLSAEEIKNAKYISVYIQEKGNISNTLTYEIKK